MMKKIPLYLFSLLFFIPQAQAASFPDLYPEHPNEEAISYLKTEGAVQGYPDGEFKAEDRIERDEFTKILIEAVYSDEEINKCTTSSFSDVPEGQWLTKYICLAAKNNIVSGYPDGTFKPTDYINFSEAAKIVAEAEKIVGSDEGTDKEWYAKYVKGLEAKKAIPSDIESFDEDITRGQMAEMTYRIEANKTDKVSTSYNEIREVLPTISSCAALEEKMTTYLNRPIYYARGEMLMDDVMAPNALAVPEGSGGMGADSKAMEASNDYSQTNLQVEGVDEADIVKNDGKYIYMVKGDTVKIVDAYPGTNLKEISTIDFNQDGLQTGFYPQELYVTDNRLVVIGQTNSYYAEPMMMDAKMIAPPYYNNKTQSKIFVYDLSDHAKPLKLKEVAFDGNYQTSRRIGNEVYLVLNAAPNYWNWNKTSNNANDFLPMMKDGSGAEEKMVDCTGVRYFPGYSVPQYLITAAVNIDDAKAKIDRDVFLGSSENVYASATDLFVATTVLDSDRYTDWDWTRDEAQSHVFRFALKGGDVDFLARGDVPGRSLNQFSMDQHNNYFRIATTTGNVWNMDGRNTSKNNVYVLDGGMKLTGKLENLAPGEQIHSTRFMGNRLYMVTFEQVDPLFVIDMANPKAPKVLGELKIPGYSDYLHPYDENHLIGFGQETSTNEDGNLVNEGFKMSLFDVTDVSNPKETDKEVIGDSGTYSELLYNHKALLFDKEKNLLAFPINIQELKKPADLKCESYTKSTCPYSCLQACVTQNGVCADVAGSCVAPTYDQYQTTFSGAMVYNVNENGFTERGRITHITAEDILSGNDYWYDYNKTIQRILYMGDYLYTVAQGGIKASNLTDTKEVKMLELGE